MKLKGIKAYKPRTVDLTRHFDQARHVIVRALPPHARAQIQELMSAGLKYATKQGKANIDIESMEQSMPAESIMKIREIKLVSGVLDHNLETETGQKPDWNRDLWDALDAVDPAILEEVIDGVTAETEGEENPTSPA